MKKEGIGATENLSLRFFIIASITTILLLTLSFAAINSNTLTTNSTGGANATTIFVLEDTQYKYILAVNNTATLAADNVTAVNITLPSGFLFLRTMDNNGTNDTYTVYTENGDTTANDTAQFSNYTSVLIWNNTATALIRNSTRRYFVFNASASQPGTYNLSVQLFNNNATSNGTTGIGNSFKTLTVVVNDTTKPDSVVFGGDTTPDRTNSSKNSIFVRINFSDNGVLGVVKIDLFNSTANYTLVNSSFTTTNGSSYAVNFTGLADGVYYVNATVNDTFNNVNTTTNFTASYNITVDTAAPTLSFSCTPNPVDKEEQITCTCTATDALSGVRTTSSTLHPSTSNTGAQSTSCTSSDYAGNSGSASFTYTVEGVSGSGSGGSGGSSGGSSGSTSTVSWSTTISENEADLGDKGIVSKSLGSSQRVLVKLSGVEHHVGVVSLTATSAVIEIASDPKQETFNVGETKKFDLDADGYYDLSVTLVSIENSKANVQMSQIREAVTTTTTDTQAGSGEQAGAGTESSSSSWIWIVLVLVVVAALIIWFVMRKKN